MELFVRTYDGTCKFAGIPAVIKEGARAFFGGAGAVNRSSKVGEVTDVATTGIATTFIIGTLATAWWLQASKRISHDGQDDHDLGWR